MAKACVYCGLQFSETTMFCPNCGRQTESGFTIRSLQETELDRLCSEMKKIDDLIRQLALTRKMLDETGRAAAHSPARRVLHASNGRRMSTTVGDTQESQEQLS